MTDIQFTIGDLQKLHHGRNIRVVHSNGQFGVVPSEQLGEIYSLDTMITPNGHNGSYTLYGENGYDVLTPEVGNAPDWSSI